MKSTAGLLPVVGPGGLHAPPVVMDGSEAGHFLLLLNYKMIKYPLLIKLFF